MEEFIENFNKFRNFLNDEATEHTFNALVGDCGTQVLAIVRDKFNKLGLNDAF